MCGRYTLGQSKDEIVDHFSIHEAPFKVEPSFNIAPSQTVAVVVADGGRRLLLGVRWGLVPGWARDPAIGARMINARAESLAEKPAFRSALAHRRCLVPADGFFEWRRVGGARVPYYVRRRDGGLFAFAGLWEQWHGADGGPLRSCAVVTVAPNALLAPIHDRMPAILRREDEARWLDVAGVASTAALQTLAPFPAEELEAFVVSPRVNTPSARGPECIARVATLFD